MTVFEIVSPKPRAHTHTHTETHTHRHTPQVILYSVPCNVLHWTDNNIVAILKGSRRLAKGFATILSYFVFCFSSLVFLLSLYVLHLLYRAAVIALFSLVVLLIMLYEIACCTCTIVWANKEVKEGRNVKLLQSSYRRPHGSVEGCYKLQLWFIYLFFHFRQPNLRRPSTDFAEIWQCWPEVGVGVICDRGSQVGLSP